MAPREETWEKVKAALIEHRQRMETDPECRKQAEETQKWVRKRYWFWTVLEKDNPKPDDSQENTD